MGRRRHLPGFQSSDSSKRSQAERQAVNSIIQGSASDIIKYAMLDVEKEIDRSSLSSSVRIVLQIHDELIYEVETSRTHEFISILKRSMEMNVQRDLSITVPLITNVNVGENWGHLTPYSPPTEENPPSLPQPMVAKRKRDND